MSLHEQEPPPIIVLIADGANYICPQQGQEGGFLKRLDVDAMILPARPTGIDDAGPPIHVFFS